MRIRQIYYLLFILFCTPLWAATAPDLEGITAENFDATYTTVLDKMAAIEAQVGKSKLKKFKRHRSAKSHPPGNPKLANVNSEYSALMAKKLQLKPVFDLRNEMQKVYLAKFNQDATDMILLHHETTRLSLDLANETERLKHEYRSIFIPILHNMMISVGVRKRGACKHWAEDLLIFLRPKERRFFDVTWGQANSGKYNEHNVAVLIPQGKTFADGLIIDPWRTSGRLWWIRVPNDHHYRWENWMEYGIY